MKSQKAPVRNAPRHSGFEPDSQRASDLVMQLLAIPGRSGEEQGVAAFLSGQLKRAGVPARAADPANMAKRRSPLRWPDREF